METLTVHVEAEVHPTESEEKVRQAVENVFGPMRFETKPLHKGTLLLAEAEGREALAKFRNLLQREHVRAAARTVLLHGQETRSIRFCLNKQVAFAGHISFSGEEAESPLGPLKVKIGTEDPRETIEYLTAY